MYSNKTIYKTRQLAGIDPYATVCKTRVTDELKWQGFGLWLEVKTRGIPGFWLSQCVRDNNQWIALSLKKGVCIYISC